MRRPFTNTDESPEISVVVPLCNEQENLPELHRRLNSVLAPLGYTFELIFVDDGSRDETPRLLAELQQHDPRVTVLSLSRNFGHQAAISAGIDHAHGEAVILMDGDLQDPPEVLPRFIDAWQDGNQVVYAVRTQRKEGFCKRCGYALFYRVLRAVSAVDIPLDSGDFCLMDRKVVNALKRLPECERFVRGLRAFVGFRQTGLIYERAARQAGQPKYTWRALCKLALDGLIGFSNAPLRLLFYGSAVCLVLALFAGLFSMGWLMVALLVCTGLQLFGMGVLGEYIRRIFVETKGRPGYIVAEVKTSRTKRKRRKRARTI